MDDGRVGGRELGGEGGLGKDDGGSGIRQHEGEAIFRVGGVEGDVSAPSFQNAENGHHHLQRSLQTKSNHVSGLEAMILEGERQISAAKI
jgi:hypothetical protein